MNQSASRRPKTQQRVRQSLKRREVVVKVNSFQDDYNMQGSGMVKNERSFQLSSNLALLEHIKEKRKQMPLYSYSREKSPSKEGDIAVKGLQSVISPRHMIIQQ